MISKDQLAEIFTSIAIVTNKRPTFSEKDITDQMVSDYEKFIAPFSKQYPKFDPLDFGDYSGEEDDKFIEAMAVIAKSGKLQIIPESRQIITKSKITHAEAFLIAQDIMETMGNVYAETVDRSSIKEALGIVGRDSKENVIEISRVLKQSFDTDTSGAIVEDDQISVSLQIDPSYRMTHPEASSYLDQIVDNMQMLLDSNAKFEFSGLLSKLVGFTPSVEYVSESVDDVEDESPYIQAGYDYGDIVNLSAQGVTIGIYIGEALDSDFIKNQDEMIADSDTIVIKADEYKMANKIIADITTAIVDEFDIDEEEQDYIQENVAKFKIASGDKKFDFIAETEEAAEIATSLEIPVETLVEAITRKCKNLHVREESGVYSESYDVFINTNELEPLLESYTNYCKKNNEAPEAHSVEDLYDQEVLQYVIHKAEANGYNKLIGLSTDMNAKQKDLLTKYYKGKDARNINILQAITLPSGKEIVNGTYLMVKESDSKVVLINKSGRRFGVHTKDLIELFPRPVTENKEAFYRIRKGKPHLTDETMIQFPDLSLAKMIKEEVGDTSQEQIEKIGNYIAENCYITDGAVKTINENILPFISIINGKIDSSEINWVLLATIIGVDPEELANEVGENIGKLITEAGTTDKLYMFVPDTMYDKWDEYVKNARLKEYNFISEIDDQLRRKKITFNNIKDRAKHSAAFHELNEGRDEDDVEKLYNTLNDDQIQAILNDQELNSEDNVWDDVLNPLLKNGDDEEALEIVSWALAGGKVNEIRLDALDGEASGLYGLWETLTTQLETEEDADATAQLQADIKQAEADFLESTGTSISSIVTGEEEADLNESKQTAQILKDKAGEAGYSIDNYRDDFGESWDVVVVPIENNEKTATDEANKLIKLVKQAGGNAEVIFSDKKQILIADNESHKLFERLNLVDQEDKLYSIWQDNQNDFNKELRAELTKGSNDGVGRGMKSTRINDMDASGAMEVEGSDGKLEYQIDFSFDFKGDKYPLVAFVEAGFTVDSHIDRGSSRTPAAETKYGVNFDGRVDIMWNGGYDDIVLETSFDELEDFARYHIIESIKASKTDMVFESIYDKLKIMVSGEEGELEPEHGIYENAEDYPMAMNLAEEPERFQTEIDTILNNEIVEITIDGEWEDDHLPAAGMTVKFSDGKEIKLSVWWLSTDGYKMIIKADAGDKTSLKELSEWLRSDVADFNINEANGISNIIGMYIPKSAKNAVDKAILGMGLTYSVEAFEGKAIGYTYHINYNTDEERVDLMKALYDKGVKFRPVKEAEEIVEPKPEPVKEGFTYNVVEGEDDFVFEIKNNIDEVIFKSDASFAAKYMDDTEDMEGLVAGLLDMDVIDNENDLVAEAKLQTTARVDDSEGNEIGIYLEDRYVDNIEAVITKVPNGVTTYKVGDKVKVKRGHNTKSIWGVIDENKVDEGYLGNLNALGGNVTGTLRVKNKITDNAALNELEKEIDNAAKSIMKSGGVSIRVHTWIKFNADILKMNPKELEGIINDEIDQLEDIDENKVNEGKVEDDLAKSVTVYLKLNKGMTISDADANELEKAINDNMAKISETGGVSETDEWVVDSALDLSIDPPQLAKDINQVFKDVIEINEGKDFDSKSLVSFSMNSKKGGGYAVTFVDSNKNKRSFDATSEQIEKIKKSRESDKFDVAIEMFIGSINESVNTHEAKIVGAILDDFQEGEATDTEIKVYIRNKFASSYVSSINIMQNLKDKGFIVNEVMTMRHKKKKVNEAYMGEKGDEVQLSSKGKGNFQEYVLEKPDGSGLIDMTFSDPQKAKEYADKKGLVIVEPVTEASIAKQIVESLTSSGYNKKPKSQVISRFMTKHGMNKKDAMAIYKQLVDKKLILEMGSDHEAVYGRLLMEFFDMKQDNKKQVETGWGKKGAVGIYRSIMRITDGGENIDSRELQDFIGGYVKKKGGRWMLGLGYQDKTDAGLEASLINVLADIDQKVKDQFGISMVKENKFTSDEIRFTKHDFDKLMSDYLNNDMESLVGSKNGNVWELEYEHKNGIVAIWDSVNNILNYTSDLELSKWLKQNFYITEANDEPKSEEELKELIEQMKDGLLEEDDISKQLSPDEKKIFDKLNEAKMSLDEYKTKVKELLGDKADLMDDQAVYEDMVSYFTYGKSPEDFVSANEDAEYDEGSVIGGNQTPPPTTYKNGKEIDEALSDSNRFEKIRKKMDNDEDFAKAIIQAAGEDETKELFDSIMDDFNNDGMDREILAVLTEKDYYGKIIQIVEYEYLNWDTVLDYILRVPSTDKLQSNLDYIVRMHNINESVDDTKNTIQMAISYKVNMAQIDLDELGEETSVEKFKSYFNIPDDADEDPNYARDKNFDEKNILKLNESSDINESLEKGIEKLNDYLDVYAKEMGHTSDNNRAKEVLQKMLEKANTDSKFKKVAEGWLADGGTTVLWGIAKEMGYGNVVAHNNSKEGLELFNAFSTLDSARMYLNESAVVNEDAQADEMKKIAQAINVDDSPDKLVDSISKILNIEKNSLQSSLKDFIKNNPERDYNKLAIAIWNEVVDLRMKLNEAITIASLSITDLFFEDQTDMKPNYYSFGFSTSAFDYDGNIELSNNSRNKPDEVEWNSGTPENWENIEPFLVDKLVNAVSTNSFKNGMAEINEDAEYDEGSVVGGNQTPPPTTYKTSKINEGSDDKTIAQEVVNTLQSASTQMEFIENELMGSEVQMNRRLIEEDGDWLLNKLDDKNLSGSLQKFFDDLNENGLLYVDHQDWLDEISKEYRVKAVKENKIKN